MREERRQGSMYARPQASSVSRDELEVEDSQRQAASSIQSTVPSEQVSNQSSSQKSSPFIDQTLEETDLPSFSKIADEKPLPGRIYILGVGGVGSFIAHSIRGIVNPPPVTLLLHSTQNMNKWQRVGRSISVKDGTYVDRRGGYQVERIPDMRLSTAILSPTHEDREPITNLIVSVKTLHTVAAIKGIQHRLDANSTICFMQNGMGVIDEINREIFKDPATRPHYLIGVISHGLLSREAFNVEHTGKGQIALSMYEPPPDHLKSSGDVGDTASAPNSLWSDSARYILYTLTRTTVLSAVGLKPKHLYSFQLEKLALNCVVNPLTAIFDCSNGELLLNKHAMAVVRLLIAEISLVIRSLPELRAHFPPVSEALVPVTSARTSKRDDGLHFSQSYKFSSERLEFAAKSIMRQTAANRSSMLRDVEQGKPTEISYINGYIVRRGEEIGIKCVMNFMISQLVEARRILVEKRMVNMGPGEKFNELPEGIKERIMLSQA